MCKGIIVIIGKLIKMCVGVSVSDDMHACVCMMYMHGWVLSINVACMYILLYV